MRQEYKERLRGGAPLEVGQDKRAHRRVARRAVSLAETFARIDAVSAADIRETAFKFINDQVRLRTTPQTSAHARRPIAYMHRDSPLTYMVPPHPCLRRTTRSRASAR